MAFAPEDIAVGGVHGYATVYDSTGTLRALQHVHDEHGAFNQTYVTGVTWRPPTNELFTVSTPDLNQDNSAHDVDWFSNDSGLLIAVVPTAGTLVFRKTDFDGNVIDSWPRAGHPPIQTDVGWGRQLVRISLICGGSEVWYTDMGRTIFRYRLTDSTQLPYYSRLSDEDYARYLYGGIRVLPIPRESGNLRDVVVAMTRDPGTGPQRAVAIASATEHWVDQINPAGAYLIQKRLNVDGTFVDEVETQADDLMTPTNDYTLSLAVNVALCPPAARVFGFTTQFY